MTLDLYRIAYKIKDVEYEPEQFPGAILKFRNQRQAFYCLKMASHLRRAKEQKEIKIVLDKAKNS